MPIILVVDDSETDRKLIGGLLKRKLDWIVQYACDGAEASDLVGQIFPDVVITDLQMPVVNGIELCTKVKIEHPHVPIILTTGVGSEGLAVEALKAGATSYVPKSNLATSLVETVEQVLAISGRNRVMDSLLRHATGCRYRFDLVNDQSLVLSTLNFLTLEMEALEIGDKAERRQASIALEEALLNGLYHGNLELDGDQVQQARQAFHDGDVSKEVALRTGTEPYSDRRLIVTLEFSKRKVSMMVRDQGRGFETAPHFNDAGQSEQLSGSGGRGLTLIKTFTDGVVFNQTGNEIRMVLKIKTPVSQQPAAETHA